MSTPTDGPVDIDDVFLLAALAEVADLRAQLTAANQRAAAADKRALDYAAELDERDGGWCRDCNNPAEPGHRLCASCGRHDATAEALVDADQLTTWRTR